jgi:hypothetical protein
MLSHQPCLPISLLSGKVLRCPAVTSPSAAVVPKTEVKLSNTDTVTIFRHSASMHDILATN